MVLLTTCQASFQSMKDYEDVKDDVESLKENIHECYSEISKTSEQIQHTVRGKRRGGFHLLFQRQEYRLFQLRGVQTHLVAAAFYVRLGMAAVII